MKPLLLSFYADDFTGATDALEVLATGGIEAALFTSPPTASALQALPGLRAFGVAGRSRSWTPAQMRQSLPPMFRAIAALGPQVLHYKVCSTFDSSPAIGSIGSVIEIGRELFNRSIPILAGAPDLGRYCVFGNLFARYGAAGPVYRIDRHPSMSRHPVTPMDEADLRVHLSRQTACSIGLLSVAELHDARRYRSLLSAFDAVLIDIVAEEQCPGIGALIGHTVAEQPTFVIGSSGVEAALCAHWNRAGHRALVAPAAPAAGPVLVVCGSCSPVTREQRTRSVTDGFVQVELDLSHGTRAAAAADAALGQGKSVVLAVSETAAAAARTPTASPNVLKRALKKAVRFERTVSGRSSRCSSHAAPRTSRNMRSRRRKPSRSPYFSSFTVWVTPGKTR